MPNSMNLDDLNQINAELEYRRRTKTFNQFLKENTPQYDWDVKHLLYMQNYLQRIVDGEPMRILFLTPPQHGKTEQNTINFASYYLYKFPHEQIIVTGYNQRRANKYSRRIRQLCMPNIDIAYERKAVMEWVTEQNGGLQAVGVGGGVTGEGTKLIIMDDVIKSKEQADSPTWRDKIWDWYTTDVFSRLHPNGSIILTMTPWHQDDLAHRILDSEDGKNWVIVKLPAEAGENDPLGRAEGEALWPEFRPLEFLYDKKRTMGGMYDALYQLEPVAAEGAMFKRSWWRRYSVLPPYFDVIVSSWDTASKDNPQNDYTVGVLIGVNQNGMYILDRFKGRLQFEDQKQVIKDKNRRWGVELTLIEETANGCALIQSLEKEKYTDDGIEGAIKGIKPSNIADRKVVEAWKIVPNLENGEIWLPEESDWVDDYISEFSIFPLGKHDDSVDATVQAVVHLEKQWAAIKKFIAMANAR